MWNKSTGTHIIVSIFVNQNIFHSSITISLCSPFEYYDTDDIIDNAYGIRAWALTGESGIVTGSIRKKGSKNLWYEITLIKYRKQLKKV